MIYLDYNATTPIDPAVAEAMRPYIERTFGNPSSAHAFGRAAREGVEAARASVASLIGATSDEVIFTSGGTESSNWVIRGVARRLAETGRHFVTTAVEHPATLQPMRSLEADGFTRTEVGVDDTGGVDPDDIRGAIRPDTILVSVMHAQNEVGTIEPVAEMGRIAREAGVLFHVDAAQSAGKIPIDVHAMNADFVSLAGHKMYAPKGIGALYIRSGVELPSFIEGAGQEQGRRAGTENVIMSVAMGKAAELASEHLRDETIHSLRDRFWRHLRAMFDESVLLNGHPTRRLPNTLSVSFPGRVGAEILDRLENVCASTGAACHAGDAKPSPVLMAMGYSTERAVGTIRFSVGRTTTEAEVDVVVSLLERELVERGANWA